MGQDPFEAGFNAVKNMNRKQLRKLARFCFFSLIALFFISPLVRAQEKTGSEDRRQETPASQAQATMASLFGRGAKMPGIPRINGTIALPAFDSSGMTIDESALISAQREGRNS